jgi:hypothetical protein
MLAIPEYLWNEVVLWQLHHRSYITEQKLIMCFINNFDLIIRLSVYPVLFLYNGSYWSLKPTCSIYFEYLAKHFVTYSILLEYKSVYHNASECLNVHLYASSYKNDLWHHTSTNLYINTVKYVLELQELKWDCLNYFDCLTKTYITYSIAVKQLYVL